jgi:hypothetical protein
MNYTDVRREIGRRLGDPDLRKYRGLVGQCFISSMCEQLEDEESYNIEEISGLIFDDHQILVFSDGDQVTITVRDDAIKLMDVFQSSDISLGSGVTLIEITQTEYKRMNLERAFRPTERELFWFRRGNKIHFIRSREASAQSSGSPVIVLQYLMNPEPVTWEDVTDLVNTENFSRNFLYKVIGKTVVNIASYPVFNVGAA